MLGGTNKQFLHYQVTWHKHRRVIAKHISIMLGSLDSGQHTQSHIFQIPLDVCINKLDCFSFHFTFVITNTNSACTVFWMWMTASGSVANSCRVYSGRVEQFLESAYSCRKWGEVYSGREGQFLRASDVAVENGKGVYSGREGQILGA